MKRTKIIELLKSERPVDNVLIKGWVRTKRDSKDFSFIEINDGSCLKNIQIIVDHTTDNYKDIIKISTGSAVAIHGKLEASKGPGQKWEVVAEQVEILHFAPENYPLQKKTSHR